jgi:5'(3')-deoxyribonucleotidase
MGLRKMNLIENMTGRQLRIAVDMDEVLADTLGKQLRLYNKQYGASVTADALEGLELADIVPGEHKEWVLQMLHAPGFFADLEPMKGALETMELLCRDHKIYIASAATEFPTSFNDKMAWLARHLPMIPTHRIIFCGDKSIVDVDYLVDDTPGHFEGLRGTGLLFDAPHNRRESGHYRVHGWKEIERAIAEHEAAKATGERPTKLTRS